MKNKFKQDKGQAGLTILLSVVVMLFMIGLLISIFAIMGNELRDSTYTDTIATVNNATGFLNASGFTLTGATALHFANPVVTLLLNATANTSISTANASVSSAGLITNASAVTYSAILVSYTYHYDADNTATNVMNDTVAGVSGATDWFDIFIVITAMVVLILLTVIIITAIQSSGMVADGETSGANNVGTA